MTRIRITCEAGHTEDIEINLSLGQQYSDILAGLLVGTSNYYTKLPGIIGHCCAPAAVPPSSGSPYDDSRLCGKRLRVASVLA